MTEMAAEQLALRQARTAAGLPGEGGDVIGHEPVHRRYRPRRRRIPRSGRGLADLEPVVIIENAVQLGVGMEVLLTRVRVR
jgi:hypothetical protein